MIRWRSARVRRWAAAVVAWSLGCGLVGAGPEEASLIRDWCAPFVAVSGVDIEWRYDLAEPPEGIQVLPHRERLVACWGVGWRLETGAGIRAAPTPPGPGLEIGGRAQVVVNDRARGHVAVSWTPGGPAHPALERSATTLAAEQSGGLFLSEYLVANYLQSEWSAVDLARATRATGAAQRVLLALDRYEFEWTMGREGLVLTALVASDGRGGVSFRQEFEGPVEEPTLGATIASRRRVLVATGASSAALQHVNTAVLERVAFLATPPEDLTLLDTSFATTVDRRRGVVLDDTGAVRGRLIPTSGGVSAPRWALVIGLCGVGLIAGGGVWWWMRRRAG